MNFWEMKVLKISISVCDVKFNRTSINQNYVIDCDFAIGDCAYSKAP